MPAVPSKLPPPCPNPFGQRFWTFYLENKTPDAINGNQAWAALLPLRRKETSVVINAPWLSARFLVESYFYPHGLALVITARCRSQLTLDETIDELFKIKSLERVTVQWADQTLEHLPLDVVADRYMRKLCSEAFGQKAIPDLRSTVPFTILTIVQGEGIDPSSLVVEDGEVHRALEAMTTWRPTWQYNTLPKLASASLQIRRSPPSHILYGRARGRAVWFPGLFTKKNEGKTKKHRSLTCYHRNLVFTSLQVESLSGLISVTAKRLRDGRSLNGSHRECAKRAAGILGRLYGGIDTYRSWSPRAQIEQNNLVEDLNQVRGHFNMPSLQSS
jgi:hypothetical protein